MKRYFRIMLGVKSIHAEECYKNNFIGSGYLPEIDLTSQLPDNWKDFNKKFIAVWMELNPGKAKVAAALTCGILWTIAKGIKQNDIVLCPNGSGGYYVGEVVSDYHYQPRDILPHRRTVRWYPMIIDRSAMSDSLKIPAQVCQVLPE